jgi:hypothetical protein
MRRGANSDRCRGWDVRKDTVATARLRQDRVVHSRRFGSAMLIAPPGEFVMPHAKENRTKGVLEERREGRENTYITVRFLDLVTADANTFKRFG